MADNNGLDLVSVPTRKRRNYYNKKYFTARAYAIFFACASAALLVALAWRAW